MQSSFFFWNLPVPDLLRNVKSGTDGLSADEAARRHKDSITKKPASALHQDLSLLIKQFRSPLILILIFAVIVSAALSEFTNSGIILGIILFSGLLGFWQERKAGRATDKLRELVQVKATVKRAGAISEIPINEIVTGDIVLLRAGDIIPGDCRLLEVNDLHVNEAPLTGESFPSEKQICDLPVDTILARRKNSVYQGTSVVNGTAVALVVTSGIHTEFGAIAAKLEKQYPETEFEKGIRKFGYMLMQITLVIAIVILSINIYLGKPIIDSFLFGLALAIGMTPELLPAIVTFTLSAGANRMARKQVIVKRLSAIQNLGSIDVFCSDKTGTLTEGIVEVYATVDLSGEHNEKVRTYAYANAVFETGFANPMDEALRKLTNVSVTDFQKVDEVPYDFIRKRLSVVINTAESHFMITKGAVKNVLEVCTQAELGGSKKDMNQEIQMQIAARHEQYSAQGFRTIGVCYKDVTGDPLINKDDEIGMTFLGFVVLFDPPKAGAAKSLQELSDAGITVKLITGDNQFVTAFLAKQIGLQSAQVITGSELSKMSDEGLIRKSEEVNVFAEMEPHQKERLVQAFRKAGHVVGFMGDGINDVSAMKASDISISVDTAVDVAKETADMVLLQKDLEILKEGIFEGRRTFANTMKYIFITTSANFGNMFSMAGVSLLVPFLPLLPKQILLTNFLTDLPGMALASDRVDKGMILGPRKWNTGLIRNFMLVFGIESSLFDFLSFFVLLYVFKTNEQQFQTGWFLVSVVTEILILLVIRTHGSIFRSKPGNYLLVACFLVVAITVSLPYSPIEEEMGFVPLPPSVLTAMGLVTLLYCFTTETTKRIFFRKMKM